MIGTLLPLKFTLDSASETLRLAEKMAPFLVAGDILLLSGEIGSGKTHFARSIIQTRQAALGLLEDVPSPTFTLVQTYQLDGLEIWHADLYRLSSADEIIELGLSEAFTQSICLIEWPDRLSADIPTRHLAIHFEQGKTEDSRILTLIPAGKNWDWLNNV